MSVVAAETFRLYAPKTCRSCRKTYEPAGPGQKFCDHCQGRAEVVRLIRRAAAVADERDLKTVASTLRSYADHVLQPR